jgi:hypothetical protein
VSSPKQTCGSTRRFHFNRHGEAFDVGLEAVDRLRPLVPEGVTTAQIALRWIIDQPQVTVVIPGARSPQQAGERQFSRRLATTCTPRSQRSTTNRYAPTCIIVGTAGPVPVSVA